MYLKCNYYIFQYIDLEIFLQHNWTWATSLLNDPENKEKSLNFEISTSCIYKDATLFKEDTFSFIFFWKNSNSETGYDYFGKVGKI